MSQYFELLKRVDSEWMKSVVGDGRPSGFAGFRKSKLAIEFQTYEETRQLVHRLFFTDGGGTRHVLFSGVASKAGCTWLSVKVAEVLSYQTTARVCLFEAGSAGSCVSTYFHISDNNVSYDPEQLCGGLARRVGDNLWVVPAESHDLAADEWSAQLVEARMLELRKDFDYVVLDAPSPSDGSCSLLFGPLVDATILVIKAGFTLPAVQHALKQFESAGVNIIGTVLNQREYPIPAPLYTRLVRH